MVDFGSNDTLSLSSSGLLREEFLKELGKHPDFILGGRASRWGEGSTDYLFQLEEHIAEFHKADSALFFNTGYEANVAVFSTLAQPHDVVLYDSLVHASIREGMYRSRATALSFTHNDLASLRQRLLDTKHQHERVRSGLALVFVALESFYSMDGDVAPLEEIVKKVKEQLPHGNAVFVIDEAHSTGLVGPRGAGLVSHLGLEKEFSIRVHTFGKAHGASGAVVLSSREFKAGYSILASIEGERRRDVVQSNIDLFYDAIKKHVSWPECQHLGIITIPMKPETNTVKSPIIPVIAPHGAAAILGQFLCNAKFRVLVVHFPVVPKDKERVRINLHADHTSDQTLSLVDLILEWTQSRRKAGMALSLL
ncbi:related to LCB2-serine C-palmitoyltransferase subunit [Fusarium fujikuroi IMI 58289]|uniref:Related to LCB2-serine C-palmitoyltransferase subunit n=1 Tax=Gibberella fujikuroi (strain CBS 195.34 / IMI 58289 / NRRL A-6831) TaxID=1279085 RepID=S0E5X0_GIBF5|nr:related to LCB2-serine C-palmitoyltransferase subunit [Fusarium fujikuroi IMI 58289]KLP03551.1 LCB2-serine C-palmitoyltransferase subunit [Fusarium fujikuroi]KLP13112.1 LCB2-serine C-palmitoyltransferase subunit [Fusarium fujikuroi]CCT67968.1 related to LCB2-serine C-palmitoyltransferase subunit [Fusarium fujikuroi IMI 58289]SCN94102.1 related to LCB2-serine C-palmitoyltransferase subunit [Fusarium fujikuroi]SCO47000.1 related to LCB2-serine C-palmitoyltransferase subunit [Fusarium fujikuro